MTVALVMVMVFKVLYMQFSCIAIIPEYSCFKNMCTDITGDLLV